MDLRNLEKVHLEFRTPSKFSIKGEIDNLKMKNEDTMILPKKLLQEIRTIDSKLEEFLNTHSPQDLEQVEACC